MIRSALFLGLCISAPLSSPSTDGLDAVRSVLQRSEDTGQAREDYLVRRLVTLGPEAGPALFSLLSGEGLDAFLGPEDGDQWLCAPDRIPALALAALGELPQVEVREHLRLTCSADPMPERLIAAWSVLARQASVDGLELVLELCAAGGDQIEHRALRVPATEAIVRTVKHDAKALRRLEGLLPAAPLAVQRFACEALAESGRADAMNVYGKLLGKDPGLDLVILRGLARLGERSPWNAVDKVAPRLRVALGKGPAQARAAAAEALGRIQDGQALPALIAALADPDPLVARTAAWALAEITGDPRPRDEEGWRTWLLAEHDWWEGEGARHLDALGEPEGDRVGALRALLAHPLGRDRVADTLSVALEGLEPQLKRIACQTLAGLRARRAVPALVELLFDTDAAVRAEAWKALCALTGESLPAEPRLWEEYAFG